MTDGFETGGNTDPDAGAVDSAGRFTWLELTVAKLVEGCIGEGVEAAWLVR